MSITLDWLQVASLLGAIQGVLLVVVLASRPANRTANRLLAVLMACFSVALASTVYYEVGWVEVLPHFFGLSYPLPLLFGPLVYLYAVTVSDRHRRLTGRDLVHFALPAAVVLVTFPVYLKSGPEKIAFWRQMEGGDVPRYLVVMDWLKFVSGVSYTAATIRHLVRHRATVMHSYSTIDRVNLRWLLWLTGAATVIWAVATTFQFAELLGLPARNSESVIAVGIAIVVYGSGYLGLRQPEVFNYVTAEFPVVAPPASVPGTPGDQAARYERSGLGDSEAESLKESLLVEMERTRPYQDSELTLADLARRLDTTPHKLSEVLSQRIGQTLPLQFKVLDPLLDVCKDLDESPVL